ncbi:sensor domain-containing protein [Streptomyces sp. WMMB303]|uniref:sensor domain-containing protein n=1 Tax=unclassified Streptomyces TaxID=2593676 RepID=UPI0023EDDAF9|nr:sensor domain-containing protein [Streptomyces sp. WMMB303]MDF4251372.1 sensor domain-containing protein [Streptomyces sp. WMMB303]
MATMTTQVQQGPDSIPRRRGRFGREVGYLLSGLPLGIAAFVLMVTGFALGVSTLILVVGLPVLAGTLSMARFLARVEAEQIAAVTGRPLLTRPGGAAEAAGAGGSRWKGVADPQAWRDLVHAVLAFPVRVATFSVTLTWLVGGVGGLTYGLWSWSIPRGDEDGVMDLAFGLDGRGPDIAFNTALGVFFLLTAVPMVRGLAVTQAGLGRVLLRREQR